ncbi:hypothetical protein [Oceanihabitans sediminis]|uniref:Glycosyl transferase n=1 Tax=Oceanihabitans sediminis TaxID=1812012 RepID=A0A368P4W9_9FLAO|nr:hypothetical protein [Oceanihabitans sediminis]MDX1278848.1 hypothetical protein [Oceanihabitans sediminis]MDX1774095.1 hypothetical protein [Oceanihabitans sediminis]RBP30864.1 hypothetical protein DFR65_104122 [Oceanihabitans sediminis]RCU56829.1 hypothetical protein DU428_10775 [Oceanihabitans sediminis]
MKKIHVGFLMSYDYELLKNAIPKVYADADAIFLAIDKDRLTWSGSLFEVKDSFFDWVKEIDKDQKVSFVEDTFYHPELSAMDCEVLERKFLADKMGVGNWIIQLDADEYPVDFKAFVRTLRKYDSYLVNPASQPIQIATFLVNIYKFVDNGFLYIDEPTKCMTATNFPNYKVGRNTKERIIYTNHLMLHETLSRDESELAFKFENWGHSNEVNPDFMEKWRSANSQNYKDLTDLFYLEPHKWKRLNFINSKDLNEIAEKLHRNNFSPSNWFLFKKNFGQWFKFLKYFKWIK